MSVDKWQNSAAIILDILHGCCYYPVKVRSPFWLCGHSGKSRLDACVLWNELKWLSSSWRRPRQLKTKQISGCICICAERITLFKSETSDLMLNTKEENRFSCRLWPAGRLMAADVCSYRSAVRPECIALQIKTIWSGVISLCGCEVFNVLTPKAFTAMNSIDSHQCV